MPVTVELFGVPRSRAGVAQTTACGASLAEVLSDLARRFPNLAETCFDGDRLKPTYVANVGGERFVAEPDTPLADGCRLLILSADGGG